MSAAGDRLAPGVAYELDKYSVDEFGRSPEILDTPLIPAYLNLLYQWRPDAVQTAQLRLIYAW